MNNSHLQIIQKLYRLWNDFWKNTLYYVYTTMIKFVFIDQKFPKKLKTY